MESGTQIQNDLIISHLSLRRVIGLLGASFPFVLSLGAYAIFGTGLQKSMSAYYHTGMGDVFIGILFAIGFFLFSYKGHEPKDDLVGDLGFLFALGVALFRTTPENQSSDFVGYLHLTFAALFFATLIVFSLFLFTKSAPGKPLTPRKRERNAAYRICGWAMVLAIALIGVYYLTGGDSSPLAAYNPVFWLEAIAVGAFGISWLIKGEAMLKDELAGTT